MAEDFETLGPELKAWPAVVDRSWVEIKDRLRAEVVGVTLSCVLVTGNIVTGDRLVGP